MNEGGLIGGGTIAGTDLGNRTGFADPHGAYGDKIEKVREFIKGKSHLTDTAIKNYLKEIGYAHPSSVFTKLSERGIFKDIVIDTSKTFSKDVLLMKNAALEYNEMVAKAVEKRNLSGIPNLHDWYKKKTGKVFEREYL